MKSPCLLRRAYACSVKSAAEDHRVSEENVGEGPGGQKMVQAYVGGKQPPHSESDVWHRPGGAKSANDRRPRQRVRDRSDSFLERQTPGT